MIAVQEFGSPHEELLKTVPFGILAKCRTIDKGGGTALMFNGIDFMVTRSFEVNQDCNLYRVVLGKLKVVWVSSVYLNKGLNTQIQALFSCIARNIPPEEWRYILLLGDFNVNISEDSPRSKLLSDFCKQFHLQISRPVSPTRGQSVLDFAVYGSSLLVDCEVMLQTPSDHKALLWSVSIDVPTRRHVEKIPNKVLANRISLQALKDPETSNSLEVLKAFKNLRRKHKRRWFKLIKYKPKKYPYLDFLLNLKEDEDVSKESKLYWRNFWFETEGNRFSQYSREAFLAYRNICKYHMYDKKDGSVVSCLRLEDGTIVSDPQKVSHYLLDTLKKIQYVPGMGATILNEFPKLSMLNRVEMEDICGCLSRGKAISLDLFSDIVIADKEALKACCEKFSDLWCCDLNGLGEDIQLWSGRVVPLNKIHPKIPDPTQFRPITIMSIIIKIVEARFLPKLNRYMVEKMIPSQTGFVRGQGIFVNLYRVLGRLTSRIKQKRYPYAIFIDFKSAYNHVNHDLLFQRLGKCLEKDEISFIRALYDRISLFIREESFHPNTGVAQGSVISPALFNIYLEPLLLGINSECCVDCLDIFGYADDVMIICDSLDQLKGCIEFLEKWALENNLPINHSKSGIVHFQSRRGPNLTSLKMVGKYEVMEEYRYLGCVLNRRLSLKPQQKLIEKKIGYIRSKLLPVLYSGSLDLRRNLWQCFAQPLFEFTLPLLSFDGSKSNVQKLQTLVRNSFRAFTLLSRTTKVEDVDFLMAYDINQREKLVKYISTQKWLFRLQGKTYQSANDTVARDLYPKLEVVTKHLPKETTLYSNLLCAMCPRCSGQRMSVAHLNNTHDLKVISLKEMVLGLKIIFKSLLLKASRKEKVDFASKFVEERINIIRSFMTAQSN